MEKHKLAKAVFDRMYEKDYCTQWMGAQLLEIDEGTCRLQMTVRKEMLNGYGILHGGIAFAFADSAFAFASNSFGRISVSINGMMHYAKPARLGDILYADAVPLHVSHKKADFDVNITNSSGEILYYFRGTVYRKSETVLAD